MKRFDFFNRKRFHLAEDAVLNDFICDGGSVRASLYIDKKTGQAFQVCRIVEKYRKTQIPEHEDDILEFGPWEDLKK